MKYLLLFLLLLTPILSFAEKEERHWFMSIGAGSTSGAISDFSINSGGTQLFTQKKISGLNNIAINFESAYLPPDRLYGFSILSEVNQYGYPTGGADSQVGFYLLPKIRLPLAFIELWGGAAVGVMLTKIAADSTTADGYRLDSTESQSASFALQPRAGLDFKFGSSFRLGIFAAYCKAKASADGSITEISSGNTTPLKLNIDRREWLTMGVALALKF